MRLTPLNFILALLLAVAPIAGGCSGEEDDDDSSETPGDDDDATVGDDDDTTGDDDDTTGDDDDTTGDDDDATGDDDDATGDDDDSTTPGGQDQDNDGFETPDDCDDTDPDVNPDATESCNEIDDNCDGSIDEELTTTFYADLDGDGFGDAEAPEEACELPEGFSSDMTDCDDTSDLVYPGAEELCNGADDNCDNSIDEGVESTFYLDADQDGDGDAESTIQGCTAPGGYVGTGTDCDDSDASIYAGATEACDSKDNDCDETVDEDVLRTFYTDGDKDGYGDTSSAVQSCQVPPGAVEQGGDCNDADASINPGVAETCNEQDDNCDGQVDVGAGDSYYPDTDGDKYGDADAAPTRKCEPGPNDVADNTDCDDTDKSVFPGAPEDGGAANGFPDGKDNDCDGTVDEETVDQAVPAVRDVAPGTSVALQGVVAITGVTEGFLGYSGQQSAGFFVNEPEGGPEAGLLVQFPIGIAEGVVVAEGDLITVTGVYQVVNGNPSVVVTDPGRITVTGEGEMPAPVDIADACAAADADDYVAMRVTVSDVTADVIRNTGFTYDECLTVSTVLFFSEAEDPDYMQGQDFYSVSGVLYGRAGTLDLELTDTEDIDVAIFSYVTPEGDTYSAPVTVTFHANDTTALIYYTLDGTEPTTSSSSKAPGETLTLSMAPTTLKFFAATASETEPGPANVESYRFTRTANAHILLSEVIVAPTDGEYIEIYNPTDKTISLDGYYLTDNASHGTQSANASSYEYVKVVLKDGTKMKVESSDFVVSFPPGEVILPFEFRIVALKDAFSTIYAGVTADFEFSTETTADAVPNMVPIAPTKITANGPTLTNDHEMVMLFYWDGLSDLVTDIDYVLWGSAAGPEEAVVKTGVEIDGPDADTKVSTYQPDTPRAQQEVVSNSAHASGASFCRTDFTESTERNTGGNGSSSQDETSEPFETTWDVCRKATPGF